MHEWTSRFSDRALRAQPSVIRGLDRIPQATNTISFGAGAPDGAVFPAERLRAILNDVFSAPASAGAALQYGPTEGTMPLRVAICAHMATLGVPCGPENVLVTNGAQQGIHLAAEVLVNPGDRVLVEKHSYPGALQVFAALGATAVSADTVQPDEPLPLIYVTPTFQNPTGRTLSDAERLALLEQARSHDAILIEDEPYEALRYEGTPAQTLLAMDIAGGSLERSRVVYLGTFSKSLAPGFRVGWAVGASDLIARMALLKQTEDLQPSSVSQAVLARFFADGFASHVAGLCDHYRARRDVLADALQSELGNRAGWMLPEGGFFFWLTLPQPIDTTCLLAVAAQRGVTFIPGSAFSPTGQARDSLRLSFSHGPVDRFAEGMRRLAAAIDEQVRTPIKAEDTCDRSYS